jgi:LDH2 family malate/lactate/ureidoglycolate dehydrogenase
MCPYPVSHDEMRVDPHDLRALLGEIFEACDMSPLDAALLADSLVAADLGGVHSHGVLRVPEYVRKLQNGVNPRGAPRVVSDKGAAIVVDAGNAMGQIAGAFAMRQAMDRAREIGVALAAVRGSNHCGAMAYYVRSCALEGLIGLASTNALPTMAPWGGLDKILGINPLGVGIPAAEEPPIIFDAAFSGSSHGKIRVYLQKGAAIPPTWAFDAEGKPTTDAAKAVEGLLQPIGGYKGVGLALVFGMLASMLSGAAYGTELGDMSEGPRAGCDGHFFLVIDPAAFVDRDAFTSRVDKAIRELRHSRRAEGVERLYAPGELEAETAARYEQEGIPLNPETLGGIRTAASQTKVPCPGWLRG